jgi:ribonuclease BN (tRNA processing enzyme)
MRLVTLGTGTISLIPGRACAGHLVTARDAAVLLDAGPGVAQSMSRAGVDWQGITHVAVTHFHADHIAELPTLVFAWKYGRLPGREHPLTIIGPPGTIRLMESMSAAYGEWLRDPGFPLTVSEVVPGESMELAAGVSLGAFKVPHTDESVAYSIDDGAARLVYTGDTGWSPELGEWGYGCDLLLCECSLPREMAIPTHLTPEECGQLASLMRVRSLVLTHFYPPLEEMDVVAAVREHYSGPVALASDGRVFELEVS